MKPFTVLVPCSTSNLGPAFDAVGVALGGPGLMVRAQPGGAGLRIARLSGEGEATLPRDDSNRIVQAARRAVALAGASAAGLSAELEIHNTIPLRRGLGSSAAAALAGALLADALCGVGADAALAAAVELEGHPDNVVPALRGGAQVSVRDAEGRVRSCAIPLGAALRAALFIPTQELSTAEARAVLPKTVPLGDAVFNLSRAALLVAALAQGRGELLGEAMEDRLHQPARATLLPWLPALIAAARAAGALGAALSGAGTTVCALCTPDTARAVAAALGEAARAAGVPGRAEVVDFAVGGARVG